MERGWTRQVSRRELVVGGIATGGLGALACEGLAAAKAATPIETDASVLRSTLAVELLVVFAYEHMLAGGTLSAAGEQAARRILGHEQAHVRRLTVELSRLGATPPPTPTSVAEADRQLAARRSSGRLADLHGELESLRLLYDIESIAVGTYYEALPKLGDPRLLRTAAAIMGAEAQHATVVGGLLHPGDVRRVVPVASVTGKR